MNKPRFQRLRAFAGCAALLLSPALTGCGTSNSNDTASGANLPRAVADARQRNTPVDATLVSRDNAFGFTLFDTLRGNQASSNVFISPVSLSLALQILYNGANSSTQQAMATTLQLSGLSVSDLNNANAALQASLVSPDAQVQLTVANSLWTRDGAVVPAFVQANQTYYGSKLGSTTGAPANVNAWVNAQTQGRIATILPDGDYSRTIAIIANAVYFKGKWTDKFDVANTQTATFTLPDGSTQSCQLMTRTGGYDYFAGSNFQMARLPYGSKRLSMIVLVPNTGIDLNTVLAGANAQTWAGWVAQLKPSNGTVQLPRFHVRLRRRSQIPAHRAWHGHRLRSQCRRFQRTGCSFCRQSVHLRRVPQNLRKGRRRRHGSRRRNGHCRFGGWGVSAGVYHPHGSPVLLRHS